MPRTDGGSRFLNGVKPSQRSDGNSLRRILARIGRADASLRIGSLYLAYSWTSFANLSQFVDLLIYERPMSTSVRADKNLSLWLASPDDLLSEDNMQFCRSLLSEGERSRMERYVKECDRREYLAAHALVRNALSFSYPLPPEAWSFTSSAFGKPEIVQKCGLEFNLAHSAKMLACLVSHGVAVGVDVEPIESASVILEIASEVLSATELSQLQKLPSKEKLEHALSLWTLKEAFAKARGTGLSFPLKSLSFTFDENNGFAIESGPGAERVGVYWSCTFEHQGHRIALFTNQEAEPLLQICAIRSLSDPPTWQKACENLWSPSQTK
jgi:4'-phosphopantetheinyl transferase